MSLILFRDYYWLQKRFRLFRPFRLFILKYSTLNHKNRPFPLTLVDCRLHGSNINYSFGLWAVRLGL